MSDWPTLLKLSILVAITLGKVSVMGGQITLFLQTGVLPHVVLMDMQTLTRDG